MLQRYLVRSWAWWLNKVPLSITTVLLLADGGRLGTGALAALLLVVLTVCAVGNFGYALNDLFDMDEDVRAGRYNAAAQLGRRRTTVIVIVSAALAVLTAGLAAGWIGAALTVPELLLPLTYSVPPIRTKERMWMGVASDALAAHVYPAALALLAVDHLGVMRPSPLMITFLMAWSVAVGLRGILSHQLVTAERDLKAGLSTVVHRFGRARMERFVILVLLPLEAGGFVGAIAVSGAGPVLWALGGLFLACEAYRALDPRFRVKALRPEGQRYLPLVEESFYKAWGPIVIALDAARVDPAFLLLIPAYLVLFRFHLQVEVSRLRQILGAISTPARRA